MAGEASTCRLLQTFCSRLLVVGAILLGGRVFDAGGTGQAVIPTLQPLLDALGGEPYQLLSHDDQQSNSLYKAVIQARQVARKAGLELPSSRGSHYNMDDALKAVRDCMYADLKEKGGIIGLYKLRGKSSEEWMAAMGDDVRVAVLVQAKDKATPILQRLQGCDVAAAAAAAEQKVPLWVKDMDKCKKRVDPCLR